MAESEGFEPPVAFRLRLISSQVHSTGLCQLSVAMQAVTYVSLTLASLWVQTSGGAACGCDCGGRRGRDLLFSSGCRLRKQNERNLIEGDGDRSPEGRGVAEPGGGYFGDAELGFLKLLLHQAQQGGVRSYFATQKDQARVEDQGQVDDDVGDDDGSLLNDLAGACIAGVSEIQNPQRGHLVFVRFCLTIALGKFLIPASENSFAGEHSFKFAEFMQCRVPARDIGKPQVGDLACGPLGAMMDASAKDNAGADIGADIDGDEGLLKLRRAAKALS